MTDSNDWPIRISPSLLTPVPLTDAHLKTLAEADSILTVWVPDERPENVATGGGACDHEGDILEFWVETTDNYVKCAYTTSEDYDGVSWYRFKPTSKDASDLDLELVKRSITEEYRSLREASA